MTAHVHYVAMESIDHLLLQCPYAREVWFKVFRRCSWGHLIPTPADRLSIWWLRAHKAIAKIRRPTFDSLVLLISWSLWLQQNSRVFRGECKPPCTLVFGIWDTVDLSVRAKFLVRSRLLGE
jgi:hypothetical protein